MRWMERMDSHWRDRQVCCEGHQQVKLPSFDVVCMMQYTIDNWRPNPRAQPYIPKRHFPSSNVRGTFSFHRSPARRLFTKFFQVCKSFFFQKLLPWFLWSLKYQWVYCVQYICMISFLCCGVCYILTSLVHCLSQHSTCIYIFHFGLVYVFLVVIPSLFTSVTCTSNWWIRQQESFILASILKSQ